MKDLLINNPKLESTVKKLADDFVRNYERPRCYEISRHLSNNLQQQGFSKPIVKDGVAIYTLDFLINSGLNKHLQDTLIERKKRADYFFVDHSWCELPEENTRIDYLPTIILPEGIFRFDKLLLIDMTKQDDRAEYFRTGKEFKFRNSTFIYTPLAGPKIGPFYLPRLIELSQ